MDWSGRRRVSKDTVRTYSGGPTPRSDIRRAAGDIIVTSRPNGERLMVRNSRDLFRPAATRNLDPRFVEVAEGISRSAREQIPEAPPSPLLFHACLSGLQTSSPSTVTRGRTLPDSWKASGRLAGRRAEDVGHSCSQIRTSTPEPMNRSVPPISYWPGRSRGRSTERRSPC